MSLTMPVQRKNASRNILWFALAALLLLAAAGSGVFYHLSGRLQLEGVLQNNLHTFASAYGGHVMQVDAQPGLRVLRDTVLVRFDDTALRSALIKEEQQLQTLAMLIPPNLLRVAGLDGREETLTERLERQRMLEETAERRLQDATDTEAQAAIRYSRASMQAAQGKLSRQELEKAEAHLAAARSEVQDARQVFETLSLERAATGVAIQRMRDMQSLAGANRPPENERLKIFEEQKARVTDLRAALAATVIVAPKDGTVIDVAVRPGDRIAPMQPCLLFLPDGQPARILALVPGNKLARLKVGQQCRIELNTPEPVELKGFVSAVTPELPASPAAGNGKPFAAVWVDILPQQEGEAGRSFPQRDTPAQITVLLRAPLLKQERHAGP